VSGDLVNLAPGCGSNAQDRRRTTGNLRATCIMDDLGTETQANSLCLQHEHVVLAVNLEGNLGLAKSLPALQDWVRWICANKCLVTCERGVSALRSDLACVELSACVT